MDLQEIKNLLSKEKNAKIVIVEDGKPVMVIASIENQDQSKFEFSKQKEEEDTSQSTEVISKQEMPVDELRVEDLPF